MFMTHSHRQADCELEQWAMRIENLLNGQA